MKEYQMKQYAFHRSYFDKRNDTEWQVPNEIIELIKKEVFDDKMIEARLCSCNAIQNLKLKDADKMSDNHTKECIYTISKQLHLSTFANEQKQHNSSSKKDLDCYDRVCKNRLSPPTQCVVYCSVRKRSP